MSAGKRTPYIYLFFTSEDGNTTYDYSTRYLNILHKERQWSGEAIIILRNDDLVVPDLRGYWLEIGYGDVTAGGNEYGQTSRMWVQGQTWDDSPDYLSSALYLTGVWEKLAKYEVTLKGSAPSFQGFYDADTTIYNIVDAVLTAAGFSLDALVQDDGIINTYMPKFYLNDTPIENARGVIYRLMSMTKSYLRPKTGKAFEVVYPQDSDSVDETYYSDQVYWFYKHSEKLNSLSPNHTIVYCNQPQDGSGGALITGDAQDATAIAYAGDITKRYKADYITSQGDADNRAAALLVKAKSNVPSAVLLTPHDARVELFHKENVNIS